MWLRLFNCTDFIYNRIKNGITIHVRGEIYSYIC